MGNINMGLKKPQNRQICSFWALWKLSESSFVFHKHQKQLKYMPAPSSHLKETFECIAYIGGLYKDQKQTKKWQKEQKCAFRALVGGHPPKFRYFWAYNRISHIQKHNISFPLSTVMILSWFGSGYYNMKYPLNHDRLRKWGEKDVACCSPREGSL